jgi:hypothetical protein
MPHKYNAERRHHIAKMKFKVTNWGEYEAGPAGQSDAVGHGRGAGRVGCRAALDTGRSGDVFGWCDPDVSDAAHGVQAAAAPRQRPDVIGGGVTGYGRRALVETTMGRYKAHIGSRLRARDEAGRRTEAAVGAAVLNRMLAAGRPNSVRCSRSVS